MNFKKNPMKIYVFHCFSLKIQAFPSFFCGKNHEFLSPILIKNMFFNKIQEFLWISHGNSMFYKDFSLKNKGFFPGATRAGPAMKEADSVQGGRPAPFFRRLPGVPPLPGGWGWPLGKILFFYENSYKSHIFV